MKAAIAKDTYDNCMMAMKIEDISRPDRVRGCRVEDDSMLEL